MKTNLMNKQFVDLSHFTTCETPCTFQDIDISPKVSFQEGNARGRFFIVTRVDNLVLNTGTHIVFPGHLPAYMHATMTIDKQRAYPVDRFIGPVIVMDVSHKIQSIRPYFDKSGKLSIHYDDERHCLEFLNSLDKNEITLKEVQQRLAEMNIRPKEIQGIIFYSGLSAFWNYAKYEAWEYLYFFGPFLQKELCSYIIENNISFVGIDSFQLEHSIINLQGQEQPFILNPACRDYIAQKLNMFESLSNQKELLQGDVLIYQNLQLPSTLKSEKIDFYGVPWNIHLSVINDTIPVHAFAIL